MKIIMKKKWTDIDASNKVSDFQLKRLELFGVDTIKSYLNSWLAVLNVCKDKHEKKMTDINTANKAWLLVKKTQAYWSYMRQGSER